MSASAQRTPDAMRGRSNRKVWIAVSFGAAGLVPLFGFYFGLAGCVCSLFVVVGRAYSARQRSVSAI